MSLSGMWGNLNPLHGPLNWGAIVVMGCYDLRSELVFCTPLSWSLFLYHFEAYNWVIARSLLLLSDLGDGYWR